MFNDSLLLYFLYFCFFNQLQLLRAWASILFHLAYVNLRCPYYLSKELHKSADIVFAPYNYVIDRGYRNSLNITWNNSVLIFDEAHNLVRRYIRVMSGCSDSLLKVFMLIYYLSFHCSVYAFLKNIIRDSNLLVITCQLSISMQESLCADAASFDLPSWLLTACISEAQSCIDLSIERRDKSNDKSRNPDDFAILKGEFDV